MKKLEEINLLKCRVALLEHRMRNLLDILADTNNKDEIRISRINHQLSDFNFNRDGLIDKYHDEI